MSAVPRCDGSCNSAPRSTDLAKLRITGSAAYVLFPTADASAAAIVVTMSSRPVALAPRIALVGAAALWGTALSGTKFALGGFGPLTLLAAELVAGAAFLGGIAMRRTGRLPVPWPMAAVLGLLEPGLAYVGETVGLNRTTAANASIIGGMEAACVVLLAWLVLRERAGRTLWLAVAAGALGLVVLEQGGGGPAWPGVGDLCVLAGVLCAAMYTIVARRLDSAYDPVVVTTRQFTVAALAVLPVAVGAWCSGAERFPDRVAARYWLAAVLVGIGGFAGSFLIYNWAITRVEARTAAVVLNLIPVFGLVSAVLWLREGLTPGRIAGGALITASVVVFTRAEMRAGAEPTPDTVMPQPPVVAAIGSGPPSPQSGQPTPIG